MNPSLRFIPVTACLAAVVVIAILTMGCIQQPAPVPVPETTVLITQTPTPEPTPPPVVQVSKIDNAHILVTYLAGKDREMLMELDATVIDSRGKSSTQHLGDKLGTSPVTIGSAITFTGSYTGTSSVSVSGYYSDGSTRNILNTEV